MNRIVFSLVLVVLLGALGSAAADDANSCDEVGLAYFGCVATSGLNLAADDDTPVGDNTACQTCVDAHFATFMGKAFTCGEGNKAVCQTFDVCGDECFDASGPCGANATDYYTCFFESSSLLGPDCTVDCDKVGKSSGAAFCTVAAMAIVPGLVISLAAAFIS